MITLKEVADKIEGKLIGNQSIPISSVDDIKLASKESISFAFLPKYKKAIIDSKASAFIVTSLTLTIIAAKNSEGDSVIERLGTETGEDNESNILGDDLLPPSDTDDPLTPPKSD